VSNQQLELRQHLTVVAELEVRRDALLDALQSQLVQSVCRLACEGLDGEVGERPPRHRASARPSSDRANLGLPSARMRLPSANSASKRSASSSPSSTRSTYPGLRVTSRLAADSDEHLRRTNAERSPPNQADRPHNASISASVATTVPARRSSAASRARCDVPLV